MLLNCPDFMLEDIFQPRQVGTIVRQRFSRRFAKRTSYSKQLPRSPNTAGRGIPIQDFKDTLTRNCRVAIYIASAEHRLGIYVRSAASNIASACAPDAFIAAWAHVSWRLEAQRLPSNFVVAFGRRR